MSETYWTSFDTPLGAVRLTADQDGLTGLYMDRQRHAPDGIDERWIRDDDLFGEARRQLDAYFDGRLRTFDLPLNPAGTPFQRQVWEALRAIPYGEVRSYGEIADAIGRPTASRAAGAANGRNPISVIVPCHRVIGASGALTGYGGGLDRKRALLDLEMSGRGVSPAPAVVA
ncbi:methylated-DNA-[protein]-cysteine S-methyltransferase [Haloactinopolyspora alba]|uniref:Methylated-DNA--protein-cysteine methyltransferase n=1 Tax=Haloactinopolyspora alba TaxID=648780 RepID=A0A2P8E728_9ACTN|nr:methylated-DNA--[protein]-cysteine S-methyltransferase [Haloactinopolyspora alba]PSL05273.1 methylated-DNA-[protein]-cysteine S-methyltransferase [Haloactinopolyspora alba]